MTDQAEGPKGEFVSQPDPRHDRTAGAAAAPVCPGLRHRDDEPSSSDVANPPSLGRPAWRRTGVSNVGGVDERDVAQPEGGGLVEQLVVVGVAALAGAVEALVLAVRRGGNGPAPRPLAGAHRPHSHGHPPADALPAAVAGPVAYPRRLPGRCRPAPAGAWQHWTAERPLLAR